MIATIKQKRVVAKDTLEITYKLSQPVEFKAGQYFNITLLNAPYNDARGLQRHFSLVNPPTQNDVYIMATRLRDSAFKKSLQEFAEGTQVEVSVPSGSFVLPINTSKPLVFIAGGIGITPFMSMTRYVHENQLSYQITLIYSNRDKKSTAYLEELQNMAKDNPSFKLIPTMTQDESWTREKRRIDADFIKSYLTEPNLYTYYLAGSPQMVEAVFSTLQQAGVEPANIISENFSGY